MFAGRDLVGDARLHVRLCQPVLPLLLAQRGAAGGGRGVGGHPHGGQDWGSILLCHPLDRWACYMNA